MRLASTRLSATVRASSALLPAAAMIAATWARRAPAWNVFDMAPPVLHHRAHLPGHELVLAVAVLFALGRLAGGGREHQLEDPLPHLGDRGLAVDDLAAVDVHVLFLPLPERRVGRELERRRRRTAVGRAAAGREADHVGAARHLARRAHRVV